MALSIVGTPTVDISGTGSIALPAHQVGDVIVLFNYRLNPNVPTPPTAAGTVPAWVVIDSGAGTVASTTYRFVATATNHTSGTWGQTSAMIAVVLRGQTASPLGGHGATETGTTASAVPAPGVTLTKTDGSSMILKFFGMGSATADWGAAPAGYTKRASAWSSAVSVCFDTKDVTTSDAAVLQPIANSFGSFGRGNAVEILALPTPPSGFFPLIMA